MTMQATRIVLLLALAPLLPAQNLALAVNDPPVQGSHFAGSIWYALQFQYPGNKPPMIAGAQFHCEPYQAPVEMALWDYNGATGGPGKLLASKKFTPLALFASLWHGALFDQPVLVKPGSWYFLGYRHPRGRLPVVRTGKIVPHFFDLGQGWQKPTTPLAWAFRVYHVGSPTKGKYVRYGTAKPGSPKPMSIQGVGWPNLGNPVSLFVNEVAVSSTPILALGRHHPGMPVGPLGTIYVYPILGVQALPPSSLQKATWRLFDLTLPADPVYLGVTVSWQAWSLVASAPGGVLHSEGLDLVVGG